MSDRHRPATKVIIFLRGRHTPSDFQSWLLRDFVPAFALKAGDIKRLAVNLVDPPPATPIYRPPSDKTAAPGAVVRPFYDALLQIWLEDPSAIHQIETAATPALAPHTALLHAYRATETVIWDRQEIAPGQQTPGISFMGRLQFHDDMPDSAARRSWTLHAALARRVHAAATRYAQNWIDEALTRDTPVARGVPDLHFASAGDMMERFFDSPQGREAVLQDTAHFIQDGPRLYTREFIVRA